MALHREGKIWWFVGWMLLAGSAAAQGSREMAAATAWLVTDRSPDGISRVGGVTVSATALPGVEGAPTKVEPGEGTTWREAVAAAAGWVQRFHPEEWGTGRRIRIDVGSPVQALDAPQAALAMVMALQGLVTGEDRDAAVGLTGGLAPPDGDGVTRLAPAPGIGTKIREARGSLRVLVIPAANREDLADLLVSDGTRPWLGVQVFVAEDVAAARRIAQAPDIRDGFLAEAMRLFDEVRSLAGPDPVDDRFRQREIYDRLRRIVEMEPGHASARMLLAVADGRVPARLSLAASLRVLASASRALDLEDRDALTKAEFAIRRQRPKLAEEVLPVWDAMHARVELLKRLADARASGNAAALADLRARMREAEDRHRRNQAFLDVLPEVQAARDLLAREP